MRAGTSASSSDAPPKEKRTKSRPESPNPLPPRQAMPDLVEQPGGDRVAVHAGVAHARVRVERSGRHAAPEAGHLLQPRDEAVAARAQLVAHRERRRLVARAAPR